MSDLIISLLEAQHQEKASVLSIILSEKTY